MEALTLDLLRCGRCGRRQLPPRTRCKYCGHDQLAEEQVKGEGEIYSFTVIRVPPARLQDEAPYAVVAVRIAEDVTLTGRLVSPAGETRAAGGGASEEGGTGDRDAALAGIAIGLKVRLVREGDDGYWFEITGAS